MSIRCILRVVLTLKILGFLDDGPLHGYELRRRIVELGGPGSHLSDGALYPALARLEAAGAAERIACACSSAMAPGVGPGDPAAAQEHVRDSAQDHSRSRADHA